MKTIELIVPCYNEEKCISKFYDRVQEVFSDMPECTFIITFVDDGSNDNTMDEINKVEKRADAGKIQYISLSRNFGKESAMYAGLEKKCGRLCCNIGCRFAASAGIDKRYVGCN